MKRTILLLIIVVILSSCTVPSITHIGETGVYKDDVHNLEMKILKVEKTQENYFPIGKGKEYIIVFISATNKYSDNDYLSHLDFTMVNSLKETGLNDYIVMSKMNYEGFKPATDLNAIMPNEEIKFFVVFDEPINDPELLLQYGRFYSNRIDIIFALN